MSQIIVPRSFGGTLLLTPTPLSPVPSLLVVATFRDGVVKAVHRDGVVKTGGR